MQPIAVYFYRYICTYTASMESNKDVTIYDIARVLNLSPATVSRGLKDHPAINIKTRKKITDMAREMGYRSNNFASNLRRQKTNTIGIIVHELKSQLNVDSFCRHERHMKGTVSERTTAMTVATMNAL